MSRPAPPPHVVRNKSDELALSRGFYWDPEDPERVKRFLQQFCIPSKGETAGSPLTLVPWQGLMVDCLYGWRAPDGRRRFKTAYVQVPKKSGKSTCISALGIYHTGWDREPGAEVVCAARVKKQARLVFDEAANMSKAHPSLRKRLVIKEAEKKIIDAKTNSVFHALSADADSADGINMSFGICDELHVWLGIRRKLFDNLRQAGRGRRQPLLMVITTAGRERHSVCYEQYQLSKRVEAGMVEDLTHFSLIYEADPTDPWDHPDTWRKCNPSIGYNVDIQSIADDCNKAKADPAAKEEFLQKTLNLWLSKEDVWIKPETWAACGSPAAIPEGSDVYLGLDLSATRDITAVVMTAVVDGKYHVVPKFWIPRDEAEERASKDGIEYRRWESEGLVTLIPGAVIDYDYVFKYITDLAGRYNVKRIAYDKRFAGQLLVDLVNWGIDEDEQLREVYQGVGMSPWIKEADRLIHQGKVYHGNHAILNWMAGNTIVHTDSSMNKKLVKPGQNSPEKIDGVVAMVMALAGAIEDGVDVDEEGWDGVVRWVDGGPVEDESVAEAPAARPSVPARAPRVRSRVRVVR